MKKLALIILGENFKIEGNDNIDVIFANNNNLEEIIRNTKNKYVAFINGNDRLSDNYIDLVLSKINNNFDACFINHLVEYKYINMPKIAANEYELKLLKPYYGEYIWSFIFNTEKLIKLLDCSKDKFDETVDELFKNNEAISDIVYYHNPRAKINLTDFCFCDVKDTYYCRNIIYVGGGCNGIFNGYISWIKNIGRCFGDKYDITILYDNMCKPTLDNFLTMFKCVKKENNVNYVCDRLLVTYSTYFYAKNIHYLESNYMFIHGNMSDYPNSRKFYDDIYTKYIAVSRIAAEKAKGYFPTDNIEFILNPFKVDEKLLKPHLKLVSAQRNSPEKKTERFRYLAAALTALDIPFTWNVFTDTHANVNENGLVFRSCVENPLPYIQDSDYFVSLSDTEALGYSVLEALVLNTKVIVTPLEAFKELGVKDGENGYYLPFEYFDVNNMENMISFAEKIYKNKDKKINYKFDEDLFAEYNNIFKN